MSIIKERHMRALGGCHLNNLKEKMFSLEEQYVQRLRGKKE